MQDHLEHHRAAVNGTELHYVSAGTAGSPVLLVHGFPESWWVFRALIPRLAARHRVFAVDLRGFGDSAPAGPEHDSAVAAADLAALIGHLDAGPVHLTGQDIGGPTTVRLAAEHPELVRSFAGIETALPGFGFEALADVTGGGVWHIGALAAPGIPALLLAGRERAFLTEYALPAMNGTDGAFTAADVDELTRVLAGPAGFTGAAALFRSALADAEAFRALPPIAAPVLAVGGGSGPFTAQTLAPVAPDLSEASIDGIGHFVAMEAPERLAEILLAFFARGDV